MTTLELIRDYMTNSQVTINELGEVRLEETGQTLGITLEGEESVINHLRMLAMDNDPYAEFSVDTAELYSNPEYAREGLKYLGESDNGDVWYQRY